MEKNTQTNSTVTTSDVETQSAQKFPTNSELMAKMKKYHIDSGKVITTSVKKFPTNSELMAKMKRHFTSNSDEEIILKGAEIPTEGNAMFPNKPRKVNVWNKGKLVVKGDDYDPKLDTPPTPVEDEVIFTKWR